MKKNRTLRLSDETWAQLTALADQARRSVADFVATMAWALTETNKQEATDAQPK